MYCITIIIEGVSATPVKSNQKLNIQLKLKIHPAAIYKSGDNFLSEEGIRLKRRISATSYCRLS